MFFSPERMSSSEPAAGGVVAFDHHEVAVLLGGVADRGAAQVEQVDGEVRGGAGDPAGPVRDLLAQVEQEPPVVLDGGGALTQAAHHRDLVEALLELLPHRVQAVVDASRLRCNGSHGGGRGRVGRRRLGGFGVHTGQMREREREPARFGDGQQHGLPGFEPPGPPALLQSDEDRGRTGVPARLQVREPPSGVDVRSRGGQPVEDDVAEGVRGVVAQHVVELPEIDEPIAGERLELAEPGIGEGRERARVLAQQHHPGLFGRGGTAHVLPGASRDGGGALAHPGPHAHRMFMGQRDGPDPVHPQGGPVRARPRLHQYGSGAVGQHPPQELRVDVSAAVEAAAAQPPARQFTADDGRAAPVSEAHLGDGRIQRGQARGADPCRREHLHGPAAQAPVHHRRETGHQQIPLRGRGREHVQIGRAQTAVAQRGIERVRGQFLVELGRPALSVEGIVALGDPVGGQDAAAYPVAALVDPAQASGDLVVADRGTGEVRAGGGDVGVHASIGQRRCQWPHRRFFRKTGSERMQFPRSSQVDRQGCSRRDPPGR